ncbi:hypothetical protein MP638_002639 [Amoeboaphelidium occidentale]|nr:hypothetical protein MP638_002639 [Amoeboaphelidium occidentale]
MAHGEREESKQLHWTIVHGARRNQSYILSRRISSE